MIRSCGEVRGLHRILDLKRAVPRAVRFESLVDLLHDSVIACLAAHGALVYADTHDGVYRLNRDTWRRADAGIADTDITALTCKPRDVCAGTRSGAV